MRTERSGTLSPQSSVLSPSRMERAMYDDLVTPELLARQILDFRQMQAFAQEPFVIVEGEGLHVTDHTGQRYLDGLSGVFVTPVGHPTPAVIAAMTEQLHRLAFAP